MSFYSGYHILFVGFKDNEGIFVIRKRGTDEIIAQVSSVSEAIDLIDQIKTQTEIQYQAKETLTLRR